MINLKHLSLRPSFREIRGTVMDVTGKPLCICQSNRATVKVFNGTGESSLFIVSFCAFSRQCEYSSVPKDTASRGKLGTE